MLFAFQNAGSNNKSGTEAKVVNGDHENSSLASIFPSLLTAEGRKDPQLEEIPQFEKQGADNEDLKEAVGKKNGDVGKVTEQLCSSPTIEDIEKRLGEAVADLKICDGASDVATDNEVGDKKKVKQVGGGVPSLDQMVKEAIANNINNTANKKSMSSTELQKLMYQHYCGG